MSKIIISESKLIKLIETAMDLELYTQPTTPSSGNFNKDVTESTEEIIQKLKELLSMMQSGKEISTPKKQSIYKSLDQINKVYDSIKYRP